VIENRIVAPGPLVTVAISALNAETTIGFAIQSIIDQTYSNWELIVWDDGSTDATPEIIGSFLDSRVRLERDSRSLGLAARLNRAITAAHGKYIARMDADDIAYPERLARQVGFLDSHPEVDLVGSSAMVFSGDGEPFGRFPVESEHARICAQPHLGFMVPHPSWLGRREWFVRYGYQESARRAQDQDLLLRAHRKSRFANLPDILLGYRQDAPTARNIVRGRWHYSRALWKFAAANGDYGLALRGLGHQAFRSAATLMLLGLGQGEAILRRRFPPAGTEDLARWRSLWSKLGEENARRLPAVAAAS